MITKGKKYSLREYSLNYLLSFQCIFQTISHLIKKLISSKVDFLEIYNIYISDAKILF